MARLTRAERQAQTRTELLDAAKKRFLDRGYAATSLDDIADDAGYSKGAIYSNFQDKPNLCREVLEAIHRERFGEVARLATADGELVERIAAVNAWLQRTAGDVGWTMLELEFAVLSRNNPTLTGMIVELRDNAAQMVISALRALFTDFGVTEAQVAEIDPNATFENLGNILLSTGIGLGIQRAVDPTVPALPATSVISLLGRILNILMPGDTGAGTVTH